MKEKKYSLSFVNEGKEFQIPKMTVQRQEELMDSMLEMEGKEETMKYNREYNKRMVWKTLQLIDKNISLEDVNSMHPEDYMQLFWTIKDFGRELKKEDDRNFRKS